jgi:hypothetical protein
MQDESGARNVLLLSDGSSHATACEECDDLLSLDAERVAELRVTFGGSEAGAGVSEAGSRRPAKKGLVSVGDEVRDASAAGAPDFSGPVALDAVADPGDLQSIGLSVSRFCERWEESTVVVCFDALDDLFEHASPDTVFRFVHVLGKRLDAADAVAHFHLDPSAHDEEVVNTFASIFDEVVRAHDAADDVDESAVDAPAIDEATDEDIEQLAAEIAASAGSDEESKPSTSTGGEGFEEATDEDIAQAFE